MILQKINNKFLNLFLNSYYKKLKGINFWERFILKHTCDFKHQDARIVIGKNTLINSSKKKYLSICILPVNFWQIGLRQRLSLVKTVEYMAHVFMQ